MAAKSTDWKTEPLPASRATVCLDRSFSPREMTTIRRGLVPDEMGDKWFIYWKDDSLFFHRSWTGICIYIVRFVKNGHGYKMIQADVNRDSGQYKETNDKRDAEMISYLVDVLLLHKEADFPSDEPSSEKKTIMNWSQVGRAMLGEYPDD